MTYQVGDVLCDMHDGFKGLPDDLEVVRDIKVRTDAAGDMIMGACGHQPCNKSLVIIGYSHSFLYLVAAYSYDGRYFGMVELRYRERT